MKRTTITLPEEMARLVESEAQRRGTSVSEVIRDSVKLALMGDERRQLPFAAICDDATLTAGAGLESALERLSTDDLFRRRR